MPATAVDIGPFKIGPGHAPALIAGPCVIESTDHCLMLADAARKACEPLGVRYIFKASFDKANRTSIKSDRGPGIDAGLKTLADVRRKTGLPVLTDVHEWQQAAAIGEVCDIIQIPAFLCRQTDLLVAAAKTGKVVNIKKGQFMAPEQMREAAAKVRDSGNSRVLLTDRGTFFGYGQLVNDMTCIPIMRELAPVVFDATHSCQVPGGLGVQSGGRREFIPTLARSGIAAGADALFLEIHDNPEQAKSDKATVLPHGELKALLESCKRVWDAVRG